MNIDDIAKSWLLDPTSVKVFQHTSDVLVDYVSYLMVTVGVVAISTRVLATLNSGDLLCMLLSVEVDNQTVVDLGPYSAGGTIGIINYANSERACIRRLFSIFMEYLPFILLLQTLTLIVVDKFSFKIPKVSRKVERFHAHIVENAFVGHDPDVAEDITDPTTSTDAICRLRQRREICASLQESSTIHHVYIGKNLFKIVLVAGLVALNASHGLLHIEDQVLCEVSVNDIPKIHLQQGTLHFQCRGQRVEFLFICLWSQVFLLLLHGVLSLIALLWSVEFRPVAKLLSKIDQDRQSLNQPQIVRSSGEDFLFLFDFLAHSYDLESTLRVLTHSDEVFHAICKPNLLLEHDVHVEEDKVEIKWREAEIDHWLKNRKKSSSWMRNVTIDSYEVTIFPAETVNHSQTISSNTGSIYAACFRDLSGGKTEYVITIACKVGSSRMKGEKVVTHLAPRGPEKPRNGMLKDHGPTHVDIQWVPPKGDFTKYVLLVDRISVDVSPIRNAPDNPVVLRDASASSERTIIDDVTQVNHFEYYLSSKLCEYCIHGLKPSECYRIQLGTKTGRVLTRQFIRDDVITQPNEVPGLEILQIGHHSCLVQWNPLESSPILKGYQVEVLTHDGREHRTVAVSKVQNTFKVTDLEPNSDYFINLSGISALRDLKAIGHPVQESMTTLAYPPTDLRVKDSTPVSIRLKWNAPLGLTGNHRAKYSLVVISPSIPSFSLTRSIEGKTEMLISKLPQPCHKYKVSLQTRIATPNGNELTCVAVELWCCSLPRAPIKFSVTNSPPKIVFKAARDRDLVDRCRIKWSCQEPELEENEETMVDLDPVSEFGEFILPNLSPDVTYHFLISAICSSLGVESKALPGKVVFNASTNLVSIP
ncbi:hypothetical protein TCAL_14320 [Tigriopus californicus]|uniref:Fibronectin type-III domain-containing protein n=1 Tax=Tigriopus californicus TaxID=6832 RepID=A0A553NEN4_TIGCA|nr:uncharacterized protein LOC131888653 [Tigriopus californicus]TRY63902.1 hypothetical protein TCAL_14320 [Tigriopus californicus]